MKHLLTAAAAAAFLTMMPGAQAQKGGIELGRLDCKVAGGAGFIIGSTKNVVCTYTPADKALAPETYDGTINKIGLDVGITGETVMQWVVFGPSKDIYAPRALAGNYVGATAEATIAVGLGANVLVGGSSRSIALQPLSVTNQTGLNAALAIGALQLTAPLK